jgi:hypothetical protein
MSRVINSNDTLGKFTKVEREWGSVWTPPSRSPSSAPAVNGSPAQGEHALQTLPVRSSFGSFVSVTASEMQTDTDLPPWTGSVRPGYPQPLFFDLNFRIWDISTGDRNESVITRRPEVMARKIRLLQRGVAQTKHPFL